jgi:Ca-activated chloride channel family protein
MRLLVPIVAVTAALTLAVAPRPVTVSGTVTSAAGGAPVVGAQVSIPALNQAAVTNAEGRYVINARFPDTQRVILRVRAIGYDPATREMHLPPTGDSVVVDLKLMPSVNQLSEVVVTGTAGALTAQRMSGSVMALRGAAGVGNPGKTFGKAKARADTAYDTEEYGYLEENAFLAVGSNPLSTFSADVDRAAYSNVRRFIREGDLPPKGAVRIEEMVNYFTYDYAAPNSAPIAIHADAAPAPWNPSHQLVRIGLQAKRVSTDKLPPANLVFLLDVSGSMDMDNKLPLVKQAFRLLVDQLRPQDRVAIVVYAGAAGLVLPSTPASEKATILAAIDRLQAGGSTAGGAGIQLAYQVAKENFLTEGNNRVILATDGDFNVGVSSTDALVNLVEAKRGDGIFLTTLGFGMGNIKDNRLEQLADKGNGNYAYVDDLMEAKKVFVSEFGGTLFTVAKDVKIQVEFNPETVQAYRLIGYENRLLAKEDFENDAKDAGEVGAGHTVTALYEVVPTGAPLDVELGSVRPFRYQNTIPAGGRSHPNELMTVSVRYKQPDGAHSSLIQESVSKQAGVAAVDLRFASAVAAYGMILHRSKYVGTFDYDAVLRLASDAVGTDREGYRADFIEMVKQTKAIVRKVAARDKQ